MIEVLGSRQSGKTQTILRSALWRAMIEGEDVLWLTSDMRTANHAFTVVEGLLRGATHDTGGIVRRVIRSRGQESISFLGGGIIRFRSWRSQGSRGLAVDSVVVDDVDDDDVVDAVMPHVVHSAAPSVTFIRRADV